VPGFILMFVVPLMPFMYFAFAVVEWIAAVAEAVIGIPLWALSFITLEGDLAGVGKEGAKMLFDIMLRPTMIVFSLLGAILVFSAAIGYFNNALLLYMDAYDSGGSISWNAGAVGAIGMLFVYMIGVYSLATSCFKLIDALPQQFGRWLNMQPGYGSIRGTSMGDSAGEMAAVGGFVTGKTANMVGGAVSAGYGQVRNALNNRRPPAPPPFVSGGGPSGGPTVGSTGSTGGGSTVGSFTGGAGRGNPNLMAMAPFVAGSSGGSGGSRTSGNNTSGSNTGSGGSGNARNNSGSNSSTTGSAAGSGDNMSTYWSRVNLNRLTSENVSRAYEKLGFEPGADPKTIKRAYRKLQKENHPDQNPGKEKEAEENSQAFSVAFAILQKVLGKEAFD
ncbi:MAG: putative rane protein, partial [Alphaproteobacteria bacterium]|nr:putative rane protein [Alphaproteobacteria bacterium]